MFFYATSPLGTVITDNYSDDEIRKGIHFRNILKDFKMRFPKGESFFINVYDENEKLVRVLYI